MEIQSVLKILKLNNIEIIRIFPDSDRIIVNNEIISNFFDSRFFNNGVISLTEFSNIFLFEEDKNKIYFNYNLLKKEEFINDKEIRIKINGLNKLIHYSALLTSENNEKCIYILIRKIFDLENNIPNNKVFFQQLIDSFPVPVFYKDKNSVYQFINEAFAKFFKTSKNEIIGKKNIENSEFNLNRNCIITDLEILENHVKQTYNRKIHFSKGLEKEVVITKNIVLNKDNKPNGIVGTIFDVTDLNTALKHSKRHAELLESMLEITWIIINTTDLETLLDKLLEKSLLVLGDIKIGSILILNENNKLVHCTSRGYNIEEINNLKIDYKKSFCYTEAGKNKRTPVVISNYKPDNKVLVPKNKSKILSTISTSIYLNDNLFGSINIDSDKLNYFTQYDIEFMKFIGLQIENSLKLFNSYKETDYLSKYDKLTNIYNRSYFDKLYWKSNKMGFYCVSIIDINGLKKINDIFGHSAGDELIKSVSKNLKLIIKDTDLLARLGGDEFIWVSYSLNRKEMKVSLDELLLYFAKNSIKHNKISFNCSFSYGISEYGIDSYNKSELMKIADVRMYNYKSNYHKKTTIL